MRILLLSLSLLVLTCCGPMYSTRFHFIPPASEQGRMCLNTCLSNKSICQNNCNYNEQNCINNAQWLKMGQVLGNAMTRPVPRKHYNPYDPYYPQPYDDLGYEYNATIRRCNQYKYSQMNSCENDYRSCYQNCGGQVLEEVYCSAFCN
jgi:hypothetical protein